MMARQPSHPPRPRSALAWILVPILAACAPSLVRAPADNALLAGQGERERALAEQRDGALTGRIAVAGAHGGGNGRLSWRQSGEDFVVELSAPISGRSWRMSRIDGRVRIDGLDGGPRLGDDAEALLLDATGWAVPIEALSAWLRGARAKGPSELRFTADGLPVELLQAGWMVSYRDWDRDLAPTLPGRVFAERGGDRVRLRIERWRIDGEPIESASVGPARPSP